MATVGVKGLKETNLIWITSLRFQDFIRLPWSSWQVLTGPPPSGGIKRLVGKQSIL